MSMKKKFDIHLDEVADQAIQDTLRAGDQVSILVDVTDDNRINVQSIGGTFLGWIQTDKLQNLNGGDLNYTAHIRSIKRNTETSTLNSLELRLTSDIPGGDGHQQHAKLHENPDKDVEEEEIYSSFKKLSRDQLEQVANNQEIQWLLRDEKLQKVLLNIDTASNREAALDTAMAAPNFKEFTDKVLGIVGSPSNE